MTKRTKIQQLIQGCKKQEWAAQQELYLLYADEMMNIAIRYAKDMSSAKDLVQETFYIFFKKIEQYNVEKGNLGAWLRRILINKSFEDYRKNQRMEYREKEDFLAQSSDDFSALASLEAEDILKLLNKLPDGCRVIFNLKLIEGYNHQEIGEMLGITASTSRSQLTRAKKLLKEMIHQQDSYYMPYKTATK